MAILPALLLAFGCGGVNASKSISPATFLVPGGFLLKAEPQPAPMLNPMPVSEPAAQPAQAE